MKQNGNVPRVFISYSHHDETWKERVATHLEVLAQEHLLSAWNDRDISGGDRWFSEIQDAMSSCSVALLLISARFLTSRFILGQEVPTLLQRNERDGLRIIPVILRPCAWDRVPWLSAIQARPKDGAPLSGMTEHDADAALAALAAEVCDLARTSEAMGPVGGFRDGEQYCRESFTRPAARHAPEPSTRDSRHEWLDGHCEWMLQAVTRASLSSLVPYARGDKALPVRLTLTPARNRRRLEPSGLNDKPDVSTPWVAPKSAIGLQATQDGQKAASATRAVDATPSAPRQLDLRRFRLLVRSVGRVFVTGPVGSGKSALLCAYARMMAHARIRSTRERRPPAPVIVELGKLAEDRQLGSLLDAELRTSAAARPSSHRYSAEEVLGGDNVVVLLDGLDEVPGRLLTSCLDQIEELVQRFPRNFYVVTSRPSVQCTVEGFRRVDVAPLLDVDIQEAATQALGRDGARDFLRQFKSSATADAQWRTPLMLAMLLNTACTGGDPFRSTYDVYNRVLHHTLSWERSKYRREDQKAVVTGLMRCAYEMTAAGDTYWPLTRWSQTAAPLDANTFVDVGGRAGLVEVEGDRAGFVHKSFQEFLAAKHIMESGGAPDSRFALEHPEVAKFLVRGSGAHELLARMMAEASDLRDLAPVLEDPAARDTPAAETLYGLIKASSEIGISFTYETEPLTWVTEFIDRCERLGPAAWGLLADVAHGIITTAPGYEPEALLGHCASALERLGWPGARLYREFPASALFWGDEFESDDEVERYDYDSVCRFAERMSAGDLQGAEAHLAKVRRLFESADEEAETSVAAGQQVLALNPVDESSRPKK